MPHKKNSKISQNIQPNNIKTKKNEEKKTNKLQKYFLKINRQNVTTQVLKRNSTYPQQHRPFPAST